MKCPACGGAGVVPDGPESGNTTTCEACDGDGLATATARAEALLVSMKGELVGFNAECLNDKLDELAEACATAGAEAYLAGMLASGMEQLQKMKERLE